MMNNINPAFRSIVKAFISVVVICSLAINANAGMYFVHSDQVGAPTKLSDSSKRVVWRAENRGYGENIVNDDVDGNGQKVTMPVRYPGQYFDAESGLHYNYFRYYDPKLGRYITSDPIGLAGGMNTYEYAGGNPVGFVDPYGLEGVGWWNDGSYIMDIGYLTDCQKEAYFDYALNMFSFGSYLDFAMDSVGVNINIIEGDDYIETGSYDPGGSSAAALGYAADYVVSEIDKSAQRSTSRSTRKGIHYSTSNSHINKANSKKVGSKTLGVVGSLLGPMGAMYDLNEAMTECKCKK